MSTLLVIAVIIAYMGSLFFIALYVEKKARSGKNLGNNAVIYSLSLAVYITSWSNYGAIGMAANQGMYFVFGCAGPTIVVLSWWTLQRKMIRIKNAYRLTSIADFISTRYNKSRSIAAIVTMIALLGIAPYVSLQLKAIFSTFDIITYSNIPQPEWQGFLSYRLLIVVLLILFTIIFGVRRLAPTEKHQGVVVALAFESVIKLIAFLSAGIFLVYFLFDGFGDLLNKIVQNKALRTIQQSPGSPSFLSWASFMIISMSTILCLPRQFHVGVIENFNEKHLKTAMWLFPLYMFIITIFILPIGMGGILLGYPSQLADTFVLRIPMDSGASLLSLLVFIGGFSASMGMIIIEAMTISTMFTNHILIHIIDWTRIFTFLKRYILQLRWFSVALFILISYWFERGVGEYHMLNQMGVIAFAAVFQFAPSMLGGLFWKKGNSLGARLGLLAGFIIWFYTLIIPVLVNAGKLPDFIIQSGPFGIDFLKPNQLFGLKGLDLISNGVFWSLIFNTGLYILGSLIFEPSEDERKIAAHYVDILHIEKIPSSKFVSTPTIYLEPKKGPILKLLTQFFFEKEALVILENSLESIGLKNRQKISVMELAELYNKIEGHLSSSIGSAVAHHCMRKDLAFTDEEEKQLKEVFAELITDLRLTPAELQEKISFYEEKEKLLIQHAGQLEEKVNELNSEIVQRVRIEQALRTSETKYKTIFENGGAALIIIDENTTIVMANMRFEKMASLPKGEIEGKAKWFQFVPDAEDRKALADYKSLRLTNSGNYAFSYEFKFRDANGVYKDVLALITKMPDTNQALVALSDISDRKKTMREIEFRNALLLNQQEASIDGILVVDENRKVLSYNKKFIEIWKLSTDLFVTGDDFVLLQAVSSRLINPDAFISKVNDIYKDKSKSTFNEFFMKDGRILDCYSAPVIGTGDKYFARIWYVRDITERKKTETALKESEEKFSKAFRYATDIIGIIRNSDRTFMEVNDAFFSLFGYSHDEVLGHSSVDFGLWYDFSKRDELYKLFSIQPYCRNMEVKWKCKSGEVKTGLLSVEFMEVNDEKCHLFVWQDITERKQYEKEISEINLKLEQRVKERTAELELANKDLEAFAYSVSHDLRTPLRAIEGFANILAEDYSGVLDEQAAGYLGRIRSASYHMNEIIENMLLLSRIKRSEIKSVTFDISEMAQALADELGASDPGRNALFVIQKGLTVTADLSLLKIAMSNLLGNAWKYTSKHPSARIEFGAFKENNETVYFIKDDGAGFDMQYADKLFHPFKRLHTPSEFKGTGIGLATVQRIIGRHGGRIWVTAEVEKGAAFYFTLNTDK